MSGVIDRTAEVLLAHTRVSIEKCFCGWSELGKSHPEHVAQALDAAGLLVSPERDAAVAAKALRDAADGFSDPDDPCHDPEPLNEVAEWLRAVAADRVDRIERGD